MLQSCPKSNEYNEANLLERVDVWLERLTAPAGLVDALVVTPSPVGVNNIDYDAKGQRLRIDYKNGATTRYTYDPETFRLIHLYTRRGAAFTDDCRSDPPPPNTPCGLQNLHYTYDPMGNIIHIRDDAQQTIYFSNQVVEPNNEYTYDPIYRLIQATGREHLGQVGGAPIPHSYNDVPRVGINWSANDINAMGRYCETYVYDAVGNFMEMSHRRLCPEPPSWTRTYTYGENSQIEPSQKSNRLTSTTIGGRTETYSPRNDGYDAHGNMLLMPQLQIMQWDFKDQLQMTQRQAVNANDSDGGQRQGERTYYVYDAGGQRVRKVTELATGQIKDERIYLGGFEVYRCYSGQNSGLVRETLHVMDDKQRIALVETRNNVNDGSPRQLIRYQFGNHLGSASLELSDRAQIISYEEYSPYGSTTYQASQTETPKRYRYTGKERDEESGLYYHGARYYAPWLGRWSSCDPIGLKDSVNVYSAMVNDPIKHHDPTGTLVDPQEAAVIGTLTGAAVEYGFPLMTTAGGAAGGFSIGSIAIPLILALGSIVGPGPLLKGEARMSFEVTSFSKPRDPDTTNVSPKYAYDPVRYEQLRQMFPNAPVYYAGTKEEAEGHNILLWASQDEGSLPQKSPSSGVSQVPDTRPMQWGAPTIKTEAAQTSKQLALKIKEVGPPPKAQTVNVLDTKEGTKILTVGGQPLTPIQLKVAKDLELVVGEYAKDFDAEPMGLETSGALNYTPTGGYSTNNVCSHCRGQLSSLASEGGFKFQLSKDRKTYNFIPP